MELVQCSVNQYHTTVHSHTHIHRCTNIHSTHTHMYTYIYRHYTQMVSVPIYTHTYTDTHIHAYNSITHTHTYTHAHIICNYNSCCMILLEMVGAKVGGCYPPYCIRPRQQTTPLSASLFHITSYRCGCPCSTMYIIYSIACANNFNGSLRRISFERKNGRKSRE